MKVVIDMDKNELMISLMKKISKECDEGEYNYRSIASLREAFAGNVDLDQNALRAFVNKMLTMDDIELGLKVLENTYALEIAFPEIGNLKGLEQPSKYHAYDAYGHTMEAVKYCENDLVLRLTMLLHDISKPSCKNVDENGKITFYGHGIKGCRKAYNMLTRMGYSKEICNEVSLYIRHHMDYAPTERSVDKMVKDLGNYITRVENLLKVKLYDRYASKGKDDEIARKAEEEIEEYRKILNKYIR